MTYHRGDPSRNAGFRMPPPSLTETSASISQLTVQFQSRTVNGLSEAKKNRGASLTVRTDCNGYSDLSVIRGYHDQPGYRSFRDFRVVAGESTARKKTDRAFCTIRLWIGQLLNHYGLAGETAMGVDVLLPVDDETVTAETAANAATGRMVPRLIPAPPCPRRTVWPSATTKLRLADGGALAAVQKRHA